MNMEHMSATRARGNENAFMLCTHPRKMLERAFVSCMHVLLRDLRVISAACAEHTYLTDLRVMGGICFMGGSVRCGAVPERNRTDLDVIVREWARLTGAERVWVGATGPEGKTKRSGPDPGTLCVREEGRGVTIRFGSGGCGSDPEVEVRIRLGVSGYGPDPEGRWSGSGPDPERR